jgi:hypothetical protein
VLLQVCGAHGSILPGHLTSSSNSSSSSNGSSAAAKAALASTAPPLAHVLAPHAQSSRLAWSPGSAHQTQQQQQVDCLVEQHHLLLQQQQLQAEHEQLLVHSLGATYRVVQAQHARNAPAAVSSNGVGSNGSSSGSKASAVTAADEAGSFSSSNRRSRRLGSLAVNKSVRAGYITSCIKRCTCWQEVSSKCCLHCMLRITSPNSHAGSTARVFDVDCAAAPRDN